MMKAISEQGALSCAQEVSESSVASLTSCLLLRIAGDKDRRDRIAVHSDRKGQSGTPSGWERHHFSR